jgi:hypothetical protein
MRDHTYSCHPCVVSQLDHAISRAWRFVRRRMFNAAGARGTTARPRGTRFSTAARRGHRGSLERLSRVGVVPRPRSGPQAV